jgi:hypothetical protein
VRVIVFLLALAACGGGNGDPDKKPKVAEGDEFDDRCDPAKDKVCVGGSVVACDDGTLGRRLRTCKDGCKDGKCVAVCPEGNELIYVVDNTDNLLSFDPRKLPKDPFNVVGKLRCPTSGYGNPFSMGVDRHGNAWILYSNNEVFKVSIADAKCEKAPFQPGGIGQFGMGYVLDAPGAKTEKLYIATNGARTLASVDTESNNPRTNIVGQVMADADHPPELTGTSEGKLYGYFPNSYSPGFVQEIDRANGAAIGPQWKLGNAGLGSVQAWAFAHWGGRFFVFVSGSDGLGSTVRMVDKQGEYKVLMENLPYQIVGAGVSTCAPEKDQ